MRKPNVGFHFASYTRLARGGFMYNMSVTFTHGTVRSLRGLRLVKGVLRPPAIRRAGGGYQMIVVLQPQAAYELAEALAAQIGTVRAQLTWARSARAAWGEDEQGALRELVEAREAFSVKDARLAAQGLVEGTLEAAGELDRIARGKGVRVAKVRVREWNDESAV